MFIALHFQLNWGGKLNLITVTDDEEKQEGLYWGGENVIKWGFSFITLLFRYSYLL